MKFKVNVKNIIGFAISNLIALAIVKFILTICNFI